MKIIFTFIVLILTIYFNNLMANEGEDVKSIQLNNEQVRTSIVETLEVLNEVYVFPDQAKHIQLVILNKMNQGAYDHIKTNIEFDKVISDELIDVSKDGHLGVMWVKDEFKEPTHILTHDEDILKNNYAFQKLEVMPGNVGYLKFNKFYSNDEAVNTVDDAFGFLKNTDALIIDLRNNLGGSPELVRYMLSHFFKEKSLLWQNHSRNHEETYNYESLVGIGSPKFKQNYPLFILIGPDTASAAEIFSYTLKHFNKAIILGENSLGIANAVSAFKINKYFVGRFSVVRPINPLTGTNWEHVGVVPHIQSSLEESLTLAHNEALKSLKLKNSKEPEN